MNNGFDLVMKTVPVLCIMSEPLCFWGAIVVLITSSLGSTSILWKIKYSLSQVSFALIQW